jgi:hypothetical protein
MSGPKRNPDKLNTIGVVVVGICGAVLVYVTIVALQAFYMNNTSELQTMADYGGQDITAKGHKAGEMRNITEAGKNAVGPGQTPTFRIPIQNAMKLVVESAKQDPAHLIPALPRSDKASIEPVFGRPKPVDAPAGAAPAEGAAPTGAATEAGAGSAAAGASAPMVPTGGSPTQPQPVAGAGSQPSQAGAPAANPTQPKAGATQPKAGATQPKAGAAQPKAGATQPKAGAVPPKAGATQPKAGAAQPTAAGSAQPK